jgi:hypothetical protein
MILRGERLGAAIWVAGGLLGLLPMALGCGSGAPSVSGTVTFAGRPLSSGTVLFHGADGRIEHGMIGEEGRYAIADAPPGDVRITVSAHPVAPAGLPSAGEPPSPPAGFGPARTEVRDSSFAAIPPRYRDPEQSGLRYTVRDGAQTHDIDLAP